MTEAEYQRLVEAAEADDRVCGLILTGSRGRGAFVRPGSDWDVRMVVRDELLTECERVYETPHGSPVEVSVYSLAQFREAGKLGAANAWDRYSFVRAEVVLDKLGGEISSIIEEKSSLSPAEAEQIATRALDGYINSFYRSVKNAEVGLQEESRLDACESLSPFLDALFALQRRVRPFNKFLRWELERYPMGDEVWDAASLLPRLITVAASGSLDEQRRLFRDMEALCQAQGYDKVVDTWEPDLAWLRGATIAVDSASPEQ